MNGLLAAVPGARHLSLANYSFFGRVTPSLLCCAPSSLRVPPPLYGVFHRMQRDMEAHQGPYGTFEGSAMQETLSGGAAVP